MTIEALNCDINSPTEEKKKRENSATCGVVMCTMGSPKKKALDLAHFEFWECVENNMLPIPFVCWCGCVGACGV